jgi:hypothetical protein
MTANVGRTLCNRLDARASRLDVLQQILKIAAYCLDAQCPVRTPPIEIQILVELSFLKRI